MEQDFLINLFIGIAFFILGITFLEMLLKIKRACVFFLAVI